MSYTTAQLEAQKAKTQQALANKQISQSQYNNWIRVWSGQYAAAKAREAQHQKQPQQAQIYQRPSKPSPFPAEPGTQVIQDNTGTWVDKNANAKIETVGGQTTVTVTQQKPPEQPGGALSLLAVNKVFTDYLKITADKNYGENTPAAALVKAEADFGISPIFAFSAGFGASLESSVYGTASLVKSGVVSAQTGKLQYSPVKTPQLGPTVSGGAISALLGDPTEQQQLSKMPFGYEVGAALGEASLFAVEGAAISKATSYGVKTYNVIAPRVNRVADAALSKASKPAFKIYDRGYTVIEPAFQKLNRVNQVIDAADARLSRAYASRIVTPAKMNVADPAINVGLRVRSEVQTLGSRTSDVILGNVRKVSPETGNFLKGVAVPNTRNARVLVNSNVRLTAARKTVNSRVVEPASVALRNSALNEEIVFQRTVTMPKINQYSTVVSKRLTAEFRAYNVVKEGRKAYKEAVTPMFNTKPLVPAPKKAAVTTIEKIDKQLPKSVRRVNKVVAGKTRYRFNLKTPEDKILASERTPLKFDEPKLSAQTVVVQAEKAEAKAVKMTRKSVIGGAVSNAPYPLTSKVALEEETVYLSKPGEALRLDTKQLVRPPTAKIVQVQKTNFDSLIRNIERQGIKQSNAGNTALKMRESVTVVPKQALAPQVTPKFDMPNPMKRMPLLDFPRGGGFGGAGGGALFGKKFSKRKLKIKTPAEMLKSLGIDAAPNKRNTKTLMSQKTKRKVRRRKR